MSQPSIIFDAKSDRPSLDIYGGDPRRRSGSDNIEFKPVKDKISPEKYAEMASHYDVVCVHDYGDNYHKSDEERARASKYYDLFSKLNRCKRKHKKLNEFVKVWRLAYECLTAVSNDNGIYRPKVFRKMVIEGKLHVTGLFFPVYIGKDRKSISWDYISDYILDPEKDPDDLMPVEQEIDVETDENGFNQYLTEEEFQRIMADIDRLQKMNLPTISTDDDPPPIYAKVMDNKESKKFSNNHPEVIRAIKESARASKKRKRVAERCRGVYLYKMTESEFDEIAKLDEERGFASPSDVPEFKGNILKRKDYKRYMDALDNYEREHCYENVNGKMKTVEEANFIKLMNELSEAGINVRALYKEKKKDKKKLEKIRKQDEKRLIKLKKKMVEIANRDEKLKKKHGIEFDVKDKDLKKSKKAKKKEKKKAKKLQEEKEFKRKSEIQRITEEAMDNVVLDTVVGEEDYENFKEYQDDMEDFTFDHIFGKG